MSLPKQKGFANIAAFFIFGFLAVTAIVIYSVSQREPETQISLLPSLVPSESSLSPGPSASAYPSPSFEIIVPDQQITIPAEVFETELQSAIYIEKIKYEKENGRPKITLDGREFGDKKNQIVLDNNVYNYGYTIISWNNDHIEFYGSEWVPKDKAISVAVIGNEGIKSNTVSFYNAK